MLRIFIVLENTSPRPGLNPEILGPVANPITTGPPRTTQNQIFPLRLWSVGLYPAHSEVCTPFRLLAYAVADDVTVLGPISLTF
jgi:hypothetical protein